MKPRACHLSIACLALALCAAAPLRAQVLYTTGFEDPPFTLGPIDGQDGWNNNGTIQSGTAYSGLQALRLDASGGFQTAKRLQGYAATGKVMEFNMKFLRTGNFSQSAGLALTGDTGFIMQLSGHGGAYYLGNTSSATPSMMFPEGVWHELSLRMNFVALTMEAWVNGNSLGTLPINNDTPPSTITIVEVFAWGTGGPASDVYVDTFTMNDVTAIVGVDDRGPTSARLQMGPAQPNPFQDGVSFAVDLPRPGRITLTISDVGGRVLARLADGTLPAGRHWFYWDGRDGAHHQLPNGVYFAQVLNEGVRFTRRAVLLK